MKKYIQISIMSNSGKIHDELFSSINDLLIYMKKNEFGYLKDFKVIHYLNNKDINFQLVQRTNQGFYRSPWEVISEHISDLIVKKLSKENEK